MPLMRHEPHAHVRTSWARVILGPTGTYVADETQAEELRALGFVEVNEEPVEVRAVLAPEPLEVQAVAPLPEDTEGAAVLRKGPDNMSRRKRR